MRQSSRHLKTSSQIASISVIHITTDLHERFVFLKWIGLDPKREGLSHPHYRPNRTAVRLCHHNESTILAFSVTPIFNSPPSSLTLYCSRQSKHPLSVKTVLAYARPPINNTPRIIHTKASSCLLRDWPARLAEYR